MLERILHIRLWDLLIAIMKIILELFDIIIDDIDLAITRLINRNKLKEVLELLQGTG